MTHSPSFRQADAARVLPAMLADVGERLVLEQDLSLDSPALKGVLATTLYSLEQDGLIGARRQIGRASYRLTPAGWLAALQMTGALSDDQLRERCTRIVQVLKAVVKAHNRSMPGTAWPDSVAAETQTPIGWLYNALESDLLARVFDKHEMNAWYDAPSRIIRIPPTFGMPR